MTDEKMIQAAIAEGFAAAKVVSTQDIVLDASFRSYCEENLCGQYGFNPSCPPDCGTPEAMKQKLLSRPNALVLQSSWELPDFFDFPAILRAKDAHHAYELALSKQFKKAGCDGFLVGASGCALCSPCAVQQGEACHFPQERYSCMSAYCVVVQKLAELCEMDYNWDRGVLRFYSMYVFG